MYKKYILYTRGGKIINKKKLSVQEWLPFEKILDNGIIKINKIKTVLFILRTHLFF